MADKLTENERAVLNLIHKGAENAISCRDVEMLTGLDRRVVHQTVYDLNLKGVTVASNSFGYFLPVSPMEWREYYHALTGSHVQRARRLTAIKDAAEREGISLE